MTDAQIAELRRLAAAFTWPMRFVDCDIPHVRDAAGYLVAVDELAAVANGVPILLDALQAAREALSEVDYCGGMRPMRARAATLATKEGDHG